MKFKVALVQFDTAQYDPETNLLKMKDFAKEAKIHKSNIAVFPEDFITGPLIGRLDLVDSDQKYRKEFEKIAATNSIDIVTGSIIEQDKKGVFNVSYYIDRSGKVKGRYCKVNLWLSERSWLSAGNIIKVFNTSYGKAAIIICWDLAFPEIFRKLKRQGVKLIFCPSWWSYEDAGIGLKHNKFAEEKLLDILCSARAMENGVAIIYCNAAGKLEVGKINEKLVGHSQVALPFKGCIGLLPHNQEGVLYCDIDTEIIDDHEAAYKIRNDLVERTLI